jgi:hypothetical protein
MANSKTSVGVGYHVRVNLNAEWHLVNSLNRSVAVRKIQSGDDNFTACQDCGKPSNLVVLELGRFTPRGRKSEYPLVWGWCGMCDIGQHC